MARHGRPPFERRRELRLGLGALLLVALMASCDDPPSGTATSGGGDGGGSVGAMGGHAGTGGDAIGGMEPGAPVIESLTTDVILITQFPTTVVVSAIVSDPQGQDDIVGGTLSSAQHLGDFVPTGVPGGYQLSLTVDESLGWSPKGYRILLATFADAAGNVTEGSTGIELDIGGCSVQPTLEACRACYCAADPAGCASYTAFEYQLLHCGPTCSAACDAFCQTVGGGTADPQLIDADCQACEPSPDDVDDFQTACLNDIPDCFGFLVDLGQCNPP